MDRRRGDGAVAELFAAKAPETQGRLAACGDQGDQLVDLRVGRFLEMGPTFVHLLPP
jgi:hypothetical protein